MICIRLFLAGLLMVSAVSCTFHSADLWYPTVAEADTMDVQWGMEKRKPRGGPKQFQQFRNSDAGMAAMNMPGAAAAVAPAPSPVPTSAAAAPAPAAAAPAADPTASRVNSLR